jgi:hypothetical protein
LGGSGEKFETLLREVVTYLKGEDLSSFLALKLRGIKEGDGDNSIPSLFNSSPEIFSPDSDGRDHPDPRNYHSII